jgi:Yip1 domain
VSQLINIFIDPVKAFTELKEKPTFWLPLLLVMALSAIMVVMYFMKVDPAWYTDHMLQASGKDMSASEMEQARKMMPSSKVLGIISAPITMLTLALAYSLFALYYMLAGKITGSTMTFARGFSLACWSSMPLLLGSIVVLIGIFTMSPQTGIESLALTHVDPLLVQLPPANRWSALAKNFDLLVFWSIFLTALGWRTWGSTSWGQAIGVALISGLAIPLGLAAYALTK